MNQPRIVITARRTMLRKQRWWWDLYAVTGDNLCGSKEGYANRGDCVEKALAVAAGKYSNAVIVG